MDEVCYCVSGFAKPEQMLPLFGLTCGRPGNVTGMVHIMVIPNQLQMFPATPAENPVQQTSKELGIDNLKN